MLPLSPASAQDYVVHRDGPDRFPISVRGDSSPLYVAALGFPGVLRAARDLQTDLQRLAGTASALTTGAPDDEEITVPSGAEMGVAVEGSRASWPGADGEAKLQTFTRFGTSSTYVDVFNRGGAPFEFRIDNHAPWLRVTPSDGRIGKQQRVEVAVDWSRAPDGHARETIMIHGPDGAQDPVYVEVPNPPEDRARGFVEAGGYVAMEASHYHRAVDAPPLRWLEIPDLGCTHSAMTTVPVTDPTNDAGAGPVLEYDIHLLSEGEIEVRAVLSPTLDFRGGGGLRYAVSIETRSRRSSTCMTAGPRRSGKKRSGTTLT